MRRSGAVLIVTALISSLLLLTLIPDGAEGQATVDTTTYSGAWGWPYQRKSWYANGLHWVAYHDGSNPVYSSSSDGESWATPATFMASGDHVWDIHFDGTYVHYARSDGTTSLYYRRGTPDSGGSITWSASEQTTTDGSRTKAAPSITVNTTGHAFIGYSAQNGGNYYWDVIANNNTDGTWSTATGYPQNIGGPWVNYGTGVLLNLTSGNVYTTYSHRGLTSILNGTLYNSSGGGVWGSPDVISTTAQRAGQHHSAISIGSSIHVAFTEDAGDKLKHNNYTISGGWDTEREITSGISDAAVGTLAYNQTSGGLVAFWLDSDDFVYYCEWDGDSWGTPVAWADETTDQFRGEQYNNVYEYSGGGYIGITYLTTTTSPYNVRVALFSVGAPDVVSVETLPATSITISGATLVGNLTSLGNETSVNVSFEWGMTVSLGSETDNETLSTPSVFFYAALTGLSSSTIYYFRAKADAGANGTFYGSTLSFTTLDVPPVGNGNVILRPGVIIYPTDSYANVTVAVPTRVQKVHVTSTSFGFTDISITLAKTPASAPRMNVSVTWDAVGFGGDIDVPRSIVMVLSGPGSLSISVTDTPSGFTYDILINGTSQGMFTSGQTGSVTAPAGSTVSVLLVSGSPGVSLSFYDYAILLIFLSVLIAVMVAAWRWKQMGGI